MLDLRVVEEPDLYLIQSGLTGLAFYCHLQAGLSRNGAEVPSTDAPTPNLSSYPAH